MYNIVQITVYAVRTKVAWLLCDVHHLVTLGLDHGSGFFEVQAKCVVELKSPNFSMLYFADIIFSSKYKNANKSSRCFFGV